MVSRKIIKCVLKFLKTQQIVQWRNYGEVWLSYFPMTFQKYFLTLVLLIHTQMCEKVITNKSKIYKQNILPTKSKPWIIPNYATRFVYY